ncbi:GTPase Era [bacterium F11]|nr:GTPase Era [bacterium F11]
MSSSDAPFRCGYVAIVGWPNVGKSTLLNALLGVKLSIVTPKPQTTRQSILGILNEPQVQLIFLDTPGWLDAHNPYETFLKKSVHRSVYDDADLIVWLMDPKIPEEKDKLLAKKLAGINKPLFVIVNKCDLLNKSDIIASINQEINSLISSEFHFGVISAKTKKGISELKKKVISALPVSPPYFPTDQLTDRWERFYVSELLREAIFKQYHDEIPHACAISIEEFREREGQKDFIKATIFVETESQKGILIGQKARSLRQLGQATREEIEKTLGREIYLEINVKVKKAWRKDAEFIKTLFQEY